MSKSTFTLDYDCLDCLSELTDEQAGIVFKGIKEIQLNKYFKLKDYRLNMTLMFFKYKMDLIPHIKNQDFDNYDNYLKSSQWSDLRKKFYKHNESECQCCDDKTFLKNKRETHHWFYPHSFEYDRTSNLVCLCSRCHSFAHKTFPAKSWRGKWMNIVSFIIELRTAFEELEVGNE